MSEDQLQPEDTLDDRGVDDVLDEGYSPPEKLRGSSSKSVTSLGEIEGETIDDRLAQEEPDVDALEPEGESWSEEASGDLVEVGDERSGRLVAPDTGTGEDEDSELVATDVGIDGAAASAEEAAMHVVDADGAEPRLEDDLED